MKPDALDMACWCGCVVAFGAWLVWMIRGSREIPPPRPASIRHIYT